MLWPICPSPCNWYLIARNPIQLKCLVKDSIIFQPGPKPPVPGKGPSQLAISSTPMFYPKVYRRITGAESEDGTPPCQLSLHSSLVDFVESPQLPAPSWLFPSPSGRGKHGHVAQRPHALESRIERGQVSAVRSHVGSLAWGCVGMRGLTSRSCRCCRWNPMECAEILNPLNDFQFFVDPMPLSYYSSQEICRNIHIRHHDQCRG